MSDLKQHIKEFLAQEKIQLSTIKTIGDAELVFSRIIQDSYVLEAYEDDGYDSYVTSVRSVLSELQIEEWKLTR